MIFLFFRQDEDGTSFFYPVDLPNEDEVLPNVECNPGTFKVTKPSGEVVWSLS